MGASITLDKASLDHLNKQFEVLRQAGPRSVYSAIMKVAGKIVSDAKLRLKGRGHVVTSRLRNSLFIKTAMKPTDNYSDNDGKSFTAELATVTLSKNEVAIGTNVEYAQKIEDRDSYLQWAVQNVDLSKSLAEDVKQNLENAMRYGLGILPK